MLYNAGGILIERGTMKPVHLSLKILLPIALGCLATPIPISAQILPDDTLPENSTVNIEDRINRIVGGTRAGENLFHSFQEFSVPQGITAYFDNALDLQNIIARVTGGNISNIDGILRANGSANLFLINPGGIAFGPDAALELGGSFVASSADSVVFDNGFEFSAANPSASPLLAVNIPIGLRFRENPGAIRVAGPGHNIRFDRDSAQIVFDDRPVGLQVATGKTLALLGGDVTLAGGNITAEEGRIEIWSGREGFLSVTFNPQNIAIAPDQSPRQLGAIRLEQAASVDVSGSGSGDMQIVGQSIVLRDDSVILANTRGSNDGGLVAVRATDSVDILGSSTNELVSRISSDTALDSTGAGGSIQIETRRLTLSDGAISSDTLGMGNAGTVTVSSEQLNLSDEAFISSDTFGMGNGGTVTVSSEQLNLSDESFISSDTLLGMGNAGNVSVSSERLTISDESFISSDTLGMGNAGNVNVYSEQLTISDESFISSGTFGMGNADTLGNAGNVNVSGEQLNLSDEASISSDTFGMGNGGTVTVSGEQLNLSDESFISSGTFGMGNAGNVNISSERLILRDESQIAASTRSAGNGGSLSVRAETVELIGGNEFGRSGLFSSAFDELENGSATGAGGDVNVIADRLTVRDRAIVSASNFDNRNLVPPGRGPAGSVSIQAREILLDNEGIITTEAAAGDRGNIALNADDIELRRGSMVTASATGPATGGNISISTDNLAALENSDISANAEQSFGGRIAIQAEGIFGTEFRNLQTPQSDITATSELGAAFSGTVELNTPDVDPGAAIAIFPQTVVDVARLIDQALCTQGRKSSFTVSGRGGIPANPADFLDSASPLMEWAEPFPGRDRLGAEQEGEIISVPAQSGQEGSQMVPARGWLVNENGEVELVGYNTAPSEQGRSLPSLPKCRQQAEKISESWR